MILFTKYSNDRRPELAIRTDIKEEGGLKSVVKAAADPRAAGHISGLMDSYKGLSRQFEGTKFHPNRCTAGDGFCEFEFLEGEMLEERMDSLLGRPDALVLALREYFDELLAASDTEFVPTDGFREVFGDVLFSKSGCCESGKRALSVANIDMVLNNIIVKDGWNVIDYEWTFHFPVPVNFIIWRAYHYYVDVNMNRQCLLAYNLLASYGITKEDVLRFEQMEENFQHYVTGGKVALRDLYPDISPGYIVIGELLEAYREKNEKRMVTLFPDRNGAFVPDNMLVTFTEPQGGYKRTIQLCGSSRLRIDPTEKAAIVHMNALTAGGTHLSLANAIQNGILLGDNDMIFTNEDPWFILTDIPAGAESVTIDMKVMPLDETFAAAWQKLGSRIHEAETEKDALRQKNEEQKAQMALMRRSARLSQDIIEGKNRAVRELGDTKVMRMYRTVRSKRKQDDPVESFRPKITNEGERILFNIDNVTAHDRYLLIHGWTLATLFGCEELSVADATGKEIPCSIHRTFRNDVAGQLKFDPERKPGFEIRIRYSRITDLPLTLRIEDPRGYIEVPVEGINEEEILRGREGEIVYEAREGFPMEYDDYAGRRRPSRELLKEQRRREFAYQPVVSFCIPVYNSSEKNLRKMVDSLLGQSYRGIEVCIADGSAGEGLASYIGNRYGNEGRVVYQKIEENPVTAENLVAAIEMSSGDVVIPADANDFADPQTAYEIVKAMNAEDADAVYTDEDSLLPDGFCLTAPVFKPDYSPDYLRSRNYIGGFFAVRRSLLLEAGLPDLNYGDACLYDFIFRCCEKAGKVAHVPMALCHRRINPMRDRENPDSIEAEYICEMRAIDAHLKRMGICGKSMKTPVKGGYRVRAQVEGRPLVSIIIPNKDHMETLRRAFDSIVGKSTYGNYEIIIVENGSVEEQTFLYYERLQLRYPFVKVITWDAPFNYSAINNFGVKEANGSYLLFLNNDVEVISPEWMEEMLSICQRAECGACGARLLFPDNTIQHMGVIVGMGGAAGHMLSGAPSGETGCGGRGILTQNVSAATAACLMVKKSVFEEIGGFDEDLAVAFNDVDLCLKIREAGYLVAVNGFAQLIHYESLTRGSDRARDDGGKHERFLRESGIIRTRWPKYFRDGDPYFNPNFDADRGDFAFKGEYPQMKNQEED
ncbi:MAG: glycosyltransferase family 2 protein [Lachnospiraceae bacterium]|nr:glycosyltransferase family 2 protein [Lachnospiraceae bacterium]